MKGGKSCFEKDRREILASLADFQKAARQRKATIDWAGLEKHWWDYVDTYSRDNWRETFTPLMKGVITEQGNRWNAEMGMQFNVQNLYALDWFNDYTLKFAQDVGDGTKKELGNLLQQGQAEGWTMAETQKRIGYAFDEWQKGSSSTDWGWYEDRKPAYRLEQIARTETMRSSNAGSHELFRAWGQTTKEWMATGDSRTRKSHLDAWIQYSRGGNPGPIPIDDYFMVGSSRLRFPGDPKGDPGETVNCRCCTLPGDVKGMSSLQQPGEFSNPIMASLWMQQQYPWVNLNAEIPMNALNDSIKEWHTLAHQYPQVARNIHTIASTNTRPDLRYYKNNDWVAYASHDGMIVLNDHYYLDYDWTHKTYQPSLGEFTVRDSNRATETMTHEFGHHVKFWLERENSAYLPAVRPDGVGDVRLTLENFLRSNRPTNGLSEYSRTNMDEAFAEGFTAIRHVPKEQWTPFVKRMNNTLETIGDPSTWTDRSSVGYWFNMPEGVERDNLLKLFDKIQNSCHLTGDWAW